VRRGAVVQCELFRHATHASSVSLHCGVGGTQFTGLTSHPPAPPFNVSLQKLTPLQYRLSPFGDTRHIKSLCWY
jgi:hypothetical protein